MSCSPGFRRQINDLAHRNLLGFTFRAPSFLPQITKLPVSLHVVSCINARHGMSGVFLIATTPIASMTSH